MPEIFLSSSTETLSIARRLATDLERKGLRTFLPARDLTEPSDYAQIAQHIEAADVFLVLVEPKGKHAAMQEREWFAVISEASDLSKKKKLIPVVLGDGEPPNFLKNWQEFRLRKPEDSKMWHKLVDTISSAVQSPYQLKFAPLGKADLDRRERRLESIATAAKQLKALGL